MVKTVTVTITSGNRWKWVDIRHFCKLRGYKLIETIEEGIFFSKGKFSFEIPLGDKEDVKKFIKSLDLPILEDK